MAFSLTFFCKCQHHYASVEQLKFQVIFIYRPSHQKQSQITGVVKKWNSKYFGIRMLQPLICILLTIFSD